MHRLLWALIGLCVACATPPSSSGERTYRESVRELLAVSGGNELGIQMANASFESFLVALEAQRGRLPAREVAIMKEVADEVYRDVFGDEKVLLDKVVPIYERHFSQAEVEEIIRFYRTPVGQKAIRELPAIASELIPSYQSLAPEISAQFEKKLRERFFREGLVPTEVKN